MVPYIDIWFEGLWKP